MRPILVVLSIWILLFVFDFFMRRIKSAGSYKAKPDHKDTGDARTPRGPKRR